MRTVQVIKILSLVLFCLCLAVPGGVWAAGEPVKGGLYDLSVTDVAGVTRPLSEFRGQVVLVVNTASQCGFTPQYEGLEQLYQKFKGRGFSVLAFPSNDFGAQEPGSNEAIKKFCELKYKTTFPVFAKGVVRGKEKQAVYQFLTEQSAEVFNGDPGWNFVKFLVDQDGRVIGRFSSMTTPMSERIVGAVEKALSR